MDTLDNPDLILALVRRHGTHSLAYSVLQPRMRYWGSAQRGFAAYRTSAGQHTFLGDPLCAPEDRTSFLADIVSAFPNALFMQVHSDTADHLRALGRKVTPVGVENEIDTATFHMAGRHMADLRHYRNKARAAGVSVKEVQDSAEAREALRPISDAWLPVKSWIGHELEFLARPFTALPEPDARIFTGSIDGRVAAFVILDPMFLHDLVTGYTVSILRHYPKTPEGTVDYIVLRIIDALASEGISVLSLGVSPFHRLSTLGHDFGRGSLAVYGLYHALYRWGNPIYHFKGLSFHKSRYRARELPVFTAVPGAIGLWPLYASARACRML